MVDLQGFCCSVEASNGDQHLTSQQNRQLHTRYLYVIKVGAITKNYAVVYEE